MLLHLRLTSNSQLIKLNRNILARTCTLKSVNIDVTSASLIPFIEKLNHIKCTIPWIKPALNDTQAADNTTFTVGLDIIEKGSSYFVKSTTWVPNITFELNTPTIDAPFTVELQDANGDPLYTDAGTAFDIDVHLWLDIEQ